MYVGLPAMAKGCPTAFNIFAGPEVSVQELNIDNTKPPQATSHKPNINPRHSNITIRATDHMGTRRRAIFILVVDRTVTRPLKIA